MRVTLLQVDAFTDKPFHGNSAAVCLLPVAREERWMQQVAAEMNLSETAFVVRREEGFNLRWFTPTVEVELCGHATLASAHALWETGQLSPHEPARFHTRSGWLTAVRQGEWIQLDFPATVATPAEAPAGLLEALGLIPRFIGRSKFDYLIEVEKEEQVRQLQPDFHRLRQIPVRGVMVTSRAQGSDCDFVSRFFAPGSGIDEDPVTGSAHCCLGPFWSERLNKRDLIARQVSARGGRLLVGVRGERVLLSGQAITVLRGELLA
ncbi:MAG: PhzF family phenazine biosynthesis protein [candidate division KSB1 bacterium]|nr:PhzF family phenazine biosynthesis protein [candidate division KSB1 bacterium]MDZ7272872.1 PhzF family phenazine biosynthesis protein [candidate division KSB1 bacterium]MDZ7284105.1 PhzF family phenazine biosynthesis protein [candidate division KSB1 bacterium]MDZ7297497.1 PhzF family phenazine biosynthesis protein [candidate division KSB1 bacterium]MDZ7305633.1 PhzF family phenazine biosynthesis protein [candidate division KSB1 bacterium]